MQPIHIVHVLHSLGTGGMEKGVTTLVRRASDQVRHSIVCLSTSGPMADRLPDGTPVIEMHKPPGNSPRFLMRLSRRLRGLRPDVVHTRNWGGLDGVVAARLGGLRRVVHGEHGWDVGDVDGGNRRRRWVRRLASRLIREYTCVSRDIGRWLRSTGIRRPITQIYNGVDTETFRPGARPSPLREQLGIASETPLIGIVGRLDPIKDHDTLFRAVDRLRGRRIDAELLVVGSGPEEARLRSLAGAGIHFLGSRSDVPDVLRAVDVFALTSLNEGISNTILEAMATALPIVATRVGGNAELVDDGICGVLIPPGDDRSLADALAVYAADSRLSHEHGSAARERVLARFSLEQMVAGYESVWTRVASNNDRGGPWARRRGHAR